MNLWEPPPQPIDSDRPPSLLPGRSAAAWSRRGGVFLLFGIILSLGIPLGTLVPTPLSGPFFVGFFVLSLGCCAIALRAFIGMYSATRQEQRAGYTTLVGRPYRRYWQLDPKTGAVIRRPGEEN